MLFVGGVGVVVVVVVVVVVGGGCRNKYTKHTKYTMPAAMGNWQCLGHWRRSDALSV